MRKAQTQEETYDKCVVDGMFIPQKDIDIARVKSLLAIAEEDLRTIAELKSKSDRWNTLYKLNYDVIHALTEALLIFERVKSANHQCLFAYLCVKFPSLELDWNFFEKIRTKRNGVHYYGTSVSREDWKEVEIQFSLYFRSLKAEIEKRLKNASE